MSIDRGQPTDNDGETPLLVIDVWTRALVFEIDIASGGDHHDTPVSSAATGSDAGTVYSIVSTIAAWDR